MATIERERAGGGGSGVLLIVMALVIVGIVISIPTLGRISLGNHAVERHADMAESAREWVNAHAGPGNRYDCPDGRVRVVVPMPGNRWAVMVVKGGVEITSFITKDQGYVKGMIDPCDQWMRFAHP
jgi:hypothetical protein